mmetsp:Transcript_63208/g.150744  ORF Transcript_63208/g.150744 Transcript_63208/m.150744 type:complete len:312 (-) Transcript_63208:353-1288(-)
MKKQQRETEPLLQELAALNVGFGLCVGFVEDAIAWIPFSAVQSGCKHLRNQEWHYHGSIGVDLHRLGVDADLAPTSSLIRSCTTVTSIKLLSCVNEDRKVCAIPHEVGIHAMVLHKSSSKDNRSCLSGLHCLVIYSSDVLHHIHDESRPFVAVKIQHITDGTVSDCWTKERNAILVSPIAHGALIVDFLPQSVDDLGRGPHNAILVLLIMHGFQDGPKPILKLAIVVVWNEEVACAINALLPQRQAIKGKLSNVELRHALYQILFDSTAGGYHDLHHLMLRQEAYRLSYTTANHVGGEAQPNLCPYSFPDF